MNLTLLAGIAMSTEPSVLICGHTLVARPAALAVNCLWQVRDAHLPIIPYDTSD